jgi:DNA-binding GntR family transcriptional regulator
MELRRAIGRRALLPGEQVRQDDWSHRLGVSGVPLREALKILTMQHIVTHDPRRGYFVAKLDSDQVAQLYRLRILVETEILSTIRWPDDDEFKILESLMQQCVDQIAEGNIEDGIEVERAFTFRLWALSPLELFVREAERLWHLADPYRHASLATRRALDPTVEGFRLGRSKIVEAIRDHDRESLIDGIVQQRQYVIELIQQFYGADTETTPATS